MSYLENGLDLLQKNSHLLWDKGKLSRLNTIRAEILSICKDTDKFLDRSQRNPLKGKIDQFKKIYIYDLYLPLHRSSVGESLDWSILDSYTSTETFQRLNLLKKLQCISASKLNAKIAGWQELYKYRCINNALDEQLEQSIKCSRCSFPDNPQDGKYSRLRDELESIDDTLESFLEQFEDKVIKEIRQYRDNIQYLENDASKKMINEILSTKKLPEKLTQQLIKDINQLFKEIEVVELDPLNDIIDKMFPNGEMITFEELQKAFLTITGDVRKNRDESSIRIKLKN